MNILNSYLWFAIGCVAGVASIVIVAAIVARYIVDEFKKEVAEHEHYEFD